MSRLDNKVARIAGESVAIGRATARLLTAASPLLRRSRAASFAWRWNNVAAVHDLPTMANWYGRVLEFTVVEQGRFDAVNADYMMIERQGVRTERICRPAGAKVLVARTAPPDHLDILGWKALLLETDDLPGATTALKDKGVDIVWADQEISATRRSTMIRDPEGNLINVFGPRRGDASPSPRP